MNKKVLSAILFSTLFAGMGTFTSCIDNDEPKGVEEVRTAYAELISAKAAVEAAKVAQVQAQAAVSQAEAELKKAEAQAMALRAEMEKAQTEAEIARIEAQVAQLKAETEAFIAQAEAQAKNQEVAYQQALIRLEQAKLSLEGDKQNQLAQISFYYEGQVENYNQKYFAYVNATRAYNEALANLEDDSVNDIETKRRLEKNLDAKKYQLSMEEDYLAKLNEELTEAKEMTPSDLQVKFAELDAELETLNDSLVLLNLEKAVVREENCDEYKKADELLKAVNDARDAEITIPALTVTDWKGNDVEIFSEDYKYSLNNSWKYGWAVSLLNNNIYNFKGYLFDENDVAWTEQTILDLKNSIEAKNGPKAKYEEAKTKWEAAAKAYKTTDGTVDVTAYLTYATLKDSVDAYNATIPAVTAAVADEKAKKTAMETAIKNLAEAKTAYQKYQTAIAAANKKVTDLNAAQKKEVEDKTKELNAGKQDLFIAWEEAKVETLKAEKDLNDNPKIPAYKKLYDAAVKDEDAAYKAYWEAEGAATKALAELEKTQLEELAAAQATQAIELAEAKLAYEKDLVAAGVYVDEDTDLTAAGNVKDPALAKAVTEAEKAYNDAVAATAKAKEAANKAFVKVGVALAKYQLEVNDYAPGAVNEYKALEIAKVAELTREEAKNVVIMNSQVVWGSKIAANDYDNIQGISEAYLINGLTKADMDAIIESRQNDKDTDFGWKYQVSDGQGNVWYEYYPYNNESGWMYQYFGLFGCYQAELTNMENIQAAITNLDAAKASIESLETALADLEAGFEAAEATVETAEEAVEAQFEVIDAIEKVVTDKIDAVYSEIECVRGLWMAYQQTIWGLEDQTSEEAIANLVENIEHQIFELEQTIYQKETEVMVAEKQLADWNKGEYSAVENAKYAMEEAEFYMNAAKAKVDAAKAYLDSVLESLKSVTE